MPWLAAGGAIIVLAILTGRGGDLAAALKGAGDSSLTGLLPSFSNPVVATAQYAGQGAAIAPVYPSSAAVAPSYTNTPSVAAPSYAAAPSAAIPTAAVADTYNVARFISQGVIASPAPAPAGPEALPLVNESAIRWAAAPYAPPAFTGVPGRPSGQSRF